MRKIPWWWHEIPADSIADCINTLEQRQMTSAGVVRELETALGSAFDYPDVVVVNSGTSAIVASLMLAGVGPGDNVIVPSMTWIATAQAAQLLGAEVRLADISPVTLNIDLSQVLELADERTRAVIPVLFNGRSAGLGEIHAWASSVGAFVVEDRCKAMGTTWLGHEPLRSDSTAAFSLGMISYISVGYGGFVGCSDSSQAEQIRLIRDHGVHRHNEDYARLGSNLKISDFVAALALSQVRGLEEAVSNHSAAESAYRDAMSGLESRICHLGVSAVDATNAGTYHEALLDESIDFTSFAQQCMDFGIEVQPYHPSISRAAYLGDYFCPNAEKLASRLVILPSGNTVGEDAVRQIVPKLADAIHETALGKPSTQVR